MADNRGGKREGAGRKSKAEEQKLIEKLSPLAPKAYKALEDALDDGSNWAVKMWFEYMYGRPKERVDVTTDGDKIDNSFTVSVIPPNDVD